MVVTSSRGLNRCGRVAGAADWGGGRRGHRDLSVGKRPAGASREWPGQTDGRQFLGTTNKAICAVNSNSIVRTQQLSVKFRGFNLSRNSPGAETYSMENGPGRGSAATPTRSWVPNYGVLRNRVVPPVQAEVKRVPLREARCRRPQAALPGRDGRLGDGQSKIWARYSERGRVGGGGVHPSASQSNHHFPNLLFCPAVAPADWPGDARRDPGKSLWGHE